EGGTGTTDFAVNRRNNKEADVPMLREQGKLVGPNDYDVPVLAVKSTEGKLLAVGFGYACHATVLDGSAWPGGGREQNPLPPPKPELAEKYGQMLGAAVSDVLAQPLTPIEPKLTTSY